MRGKESPFRIKKKIKTPLPFGGVLILMLKPIKTTMGRLACALMLRVTCVTVE
jgi:hypothetical protein